MLFKVQRYNLNIFTIFIIDVVDFTQKRHCIFMPIFSQFSTNFIANMTTKKPIDQNYIWRQLIIRSANNFIFDLKDKEIDLKQFSIEELYNLVAVFDDVLSKARLFKDELEKRIE